MSKEKKVSPRFVPDRDSKYMGLAWMHAGFSKDPNTQVGAQIVSVYNEPLGSGYNGPPAKINDKSFCWKRPAPEERHLFSKYDVIVHAEKNAINRCCGYDLSNSTLYVTAFPCKDCMLDIANANISRIVYMDNRSDKNSMLQNTDERDISLKIASMARIKIELFAGSILWVADWVEKMKLMGVFGATEST